jgi:hypothetical protein
VGCVKDFEYELKLQPDAKTFLHRPTPFPPQKRKWVKEECDKLVTSGVLERISHCECASNIVLVDEGQSG